MRELPPHEQREAPPLAPAAVPPRIDATRTDLRSTVAARPQDTAETMVPGNAFWRQTYDVAAGEFLDDHWQALHTVKSAQELQTAVGDRVPPEFLADVAAGLRKAPMSMRVTPYILSLIDWRAPYDDPLRTQFIPVASRMKPDHPKLTFDALAEQDDAPLPGLTHRYPDRALFLALHTCPVYCRFCTRSYDVGPATDTADKASIGVDRERWQRSIDYIAAHPDICDVVVSGGDTSLLRPEQVRWIGRTLLSLPAIRRIRFATKVLAVLPQKLLRDSSPWLQALAEVADYGRGMEKDVALHTHANHPNEISWITAQAAQQLYRRGIACRNQSVLLHGVNDNSDVMKTLVRKLSDCHITPYYVYVHDLVKGVEDLRTTLHTALDIEKSVRGAIAGFLAPTFVVDTLGGGGKRNAHSFECYNRTTGVAVYTSPVKPGRYFFSFDPIHLLPEEGQRRWADPAQHQAIIDEAAAMARDAQR